jgi:hypothetical protein
VIKEQHDLIDKLMVSNNLALTLDGRLVCTDCGVEFNLTQNINRWLPGLRAALTGNDDLLKVTTTDTNTNTKVTTTGTNTNTKAITTDTTTEIFLSLNIGWDSEHHAWNSSVEGLRRVLAHGDTLAANLTSLAVARCVFDERNLHARSADAIHDVGGVDAHPHV